MLHLLFIPTKRGYNHITIKLLVVVKVVDDMFRITTMPQYLTTKLTRVCLDYNGLLNHGMGLAGQANP